MLPSKTFVKTSHVRLVRDAAGELSAPVTSLLTARGSFPSRRACNQWQKVTHTFAIIHALRRAALLPHTSVTHVAHADEKKPNTDAHPHTYLDQYIRI